jgi:hypothetical protein
MGTHLKSSEDEGIRRIKSVKKKIVVLVWMPFFFLEEIATAVTELQRKKKNEAVSYTLSSFRVAIGFCSLLHKCTYPVCNFFVFFSLSSFCCWANL